MTPNYQPFSIRTSPVYLCYNAIENIVERKYPNIRMEERKLFIERMKHIEPGTTKWVADAEMYSCPVYTNMLKNPSILNVFVYDPKYCSEEDLYNINFAQGTIAFDENLIKNTYIAIPITRDETLKDEEVIQLALMLARFCKEYFSELETVNQYVFETLCTYIPYYYILHRCSGITKEFFNRIVNEVDDIESDIFPITYRESDEYYDEVINQACLYTDPNDIIKVSMKLRTCYNETADNSSQT